MAISPFVVVQSPSCVWLCDPIHGSTPGFQSFTISWSLLKLMSIESVIPSNHLILCHPLLHLPSVFPSISLFQFCIMGQSIGASASASVLPMSIQSWFPLGLTGLIFLLCKGLSRVLQHHNLKALIFQCSAFFMAQLSHPFVTTGKTIALTIWTFVGKVMSVLFNLLYSLS